MAQESAEEDRGPFRDWSEEERQAFIDQYGDISDELTLLQCPRQTEPQYWEIDAATRDALRSTGYADEEIAALRTQYSYFNSGVEWSSNVWTVDFFPASDTDSDIASDHLSVQVDVNSSEITACTVFSYGKERYYRAALSLYEKQELVIEELQKENTRLSEELKTAEELLNEKCT